MEAKHTKGPWEIWDNDDNHSGPGCWYKIKHVEEIVCEIYAIDEENPDTEKHEANARLIAAAPELLEALEKIMLLECMECELVTGSRCDSMDECRKDAVSIGFAAIAEAKGES